MKAVIIEDEAIAVEVLMKLLRDVAPNIEVVAVLGTVKESIEWIKTNPLPNVAFVDIHLADGSSFAIFEECRFDCPIIFTTAYDQYAIKAFDVNSIGYLLKPIDKNKLRSAVERVKIDDAIDNRLLVESIVASMRRSKVSYKQNILISQRDKLLPLSVLLVAYFYVEGRQVLAMTTSGKEYRVDMTLDELQEHLNPTSFFRANRQFIVQHAAVKELTQWFSGKYILGLLVETPEQIIIPKAKVASLKEWITLGE